MFAPDLPHISAAVVLGADFMQFGDPLDWLAAQFSLGFKVRREELAESLSYSAGGSRLRLPCAEAAGTDGRSYFRFEIFGKCNHRMTALLSMTFRPFTLTRKDLEEYASAMMIRDQKNVLGVQATTGKAVGTLAPVTVPTEKRLVRLMEMNVFNPAFFEEQIERLKVEREVSVFDINGMASVVTLSQPWLYYDVGAKGRSRKSKQPLLLPFNGEALRKGAPGE